MAELKPDDERFQQLEFQFAEKASEVLKTVINMETTVFYEGIGQAEEEALKSLEAEELVCVRMSFDRLLSGEAVFLLDKTLTAKIVDFMIMGDGEVEFMPDEHLDGILEAINQVMGAEVTRLNGLFNVDMHVEVEKAEVLDLKAIQEQFGDWVLVRLTTEIEGQGNYKMAKLYAPGLFEQLQKLAVPEEGGAGQAGGEAPASGGVDEAAGKDVQSARFGEFPPSGRPAAAAPPRQDNIVPDSMQRVMDLSLPIVIELGRTRMLIKDIIDLAPGSIVELEKLTGEPVDLFVNGKKFAHGEVVVVDENFGVRIVELLTIEERLANVQEGA